MTIGANEMSRLEEAAEAEKRKVRERQLLLDRLADLGGRQTAEEDVTFSGTKLVIPAKMTMKAAVTFLEEKITEDEREVTFSRTYKYRPWDGARATMTALKKAFGMVAQRPTPSFFGDIPPQLVTIPVSATETDQVPWGRLGVVHLPGCVLSLGGEVHVELGTIFRLVASGPRKYRFEVEGIFRLVEEELRTNSLYRGKAFDGQEHPQFLDLSGVDPSKVIYSEEVTTQLEANVWALLRWPEKMRELGVPLKRAILLEGPFGTGKTLCAYLTAKVAAAHGWTFVMCRPGRDEFRDVMATARLYQPSVVFFEDVDRMSGNDGSDRVSELLDLFDGLQAKGTDIICILTTNHVERIHKGMVRPGRLDAVVHIGSLDHQGIRRLVEATVPADLLDPSIDWTAVGDSMDGYLPAFCREAIDRTVRYNVSRNQGQATKLGTEDFVAAANGLRPQLDLMNGAGEGDQLDTVGVALERVVATAVTEKLRATEVQDSDGDAAYWLVPNGQQQ